MKLAGNVHHAVAGFAPRWTRATGAAPSVYDRLAPHYDRLHRRWLRYAGGEAQAALEAAVRAVVHPGAHLLDAGCGTGAFARGLFRDRVALGAITLLDPAPAMLARCQDIAARRVNGRLEALPFADGAFDVVTCAWALETVADTPRALAELSRVLRPSGWLCVAFCARKPARGVADWALRKSVEWRATGRFLSPDGVAHSLSNGGAFDVRPLPTQGPACALMARRRAQA